VLAVLVIATTAHAEDALLAKLPKVKNAEAHAHIVSGNAYYRTKKFEQALSEYEKGVQLEDAAIFLYNIGQCHRALHHWDDAIWVYRRFLDRAKPEPALVERVEGFLKDAEQNRAEDQKRAPLREPVDTASAGERRTPQPASAPQPSPSPVMPGPSSSAMRIVRGEPWYRDPLGWTETGVGVVGIGVGAWLLADVASLNDEANKTMNVEARSSLFARAHTRRTEGAVVGAVGVVAAVVGIVTLIRHPEDHEEPVRAAWHVDVTGNGLAVSGGF
jgi:tetratricopeptide (TPR) repeat protein